jgi:hypothetical protein
LRLIIQGLLFRIYSSGVGLIDEGSGLLFRVYCSGLVVQGLLCRVQVDCLGFLVQGLLFRVWEGGRPDAESHGRDHARGYLPPGSYSRLIDGCITQL